jgi:hypothetical protein
MDGRVFDRWIKTLGTGTDRRTTLKTLAAGALATTAGSLAAARRVEAAEEHFCCVYTCAPANKLLHRCVRKVSSPGPCPAELHGCGLLRQNSVTKCSACGALGAG